jgi:hypothetical protein
MSTTQYEKIFCCSAARSLCLLSSLACLFFLQNAKAPKKKTQNISNLSLFKYRKRKRKKKTARKKEDKPRMEGRKNITKAKVNVEFRRPTKSKKAEKDSKIQSTERRLENFNSSPLISLLVGFKRRNFHTTMLSDGALKKEVVVVVGG